MTTKGRKRAGQPDPHKLYNQGVRFLLAEVCLREHSASSRQIQDWVALPAMVLSSFASEVFLKCLITIDGDKPAEIHNLRALFDSLTKPRKRRIEELWNQAIAVREEEFKTNERLSGLRIPRDLRTALLDCGGAFTTLRYVYEDPTKGMFYIPDFALILKNTISEIRPELR